MQTVRNSGGGGAAGLRTFFSPGAIVVGTLLALGAALVGALVLSLAVTLAEWDPIPPSLTLFHYVSVALGAVLAARSAKRFGWLHGGVVGVIYLFIVSALFRPDFAPADALEAAWLVQAWWAFLAGLAGGVVGVNT